MSSTPELQLPDRWHYTAPLISSENRPDQPSHAQKDPTVVCHEGRWHVFMTVRLPDRTAIEHVSFTDWADADASPRTLLELVDGPYFCAPQVFYFEPHGLWYLIHQAKGIDPAATKMQVMYSTTRDIDDPTSWTKGTPMLDGGPSDPRLTGGIDFWVICDHARAYLFYTGPKGKFWRMWTTLDQFPHGFDHCELALEGPFFEAAHTYRLAGLDRYLMIVEQDHTRHYKAYLAHTLDEDWRPIADTELRPFAGGANIEPAEGVAAWTDNISHGELIRASNDQTLTVDPNDLRFVFQGMWDADKVGKGYGEWQWRIGLLTPASS